MTTPPRKLGTKAVEDCWVIVESAMRDAFSYLVLGRTGATIGKNQVKTAMEWYNLVYQACNPGQGQGSNASREAAEVFYYRSLELIQSFGPDLTSQIIIKEGDKMLEQIAITYKNYRVFVKKFFLSVLSFVPRVVTEAKDLELKLMTSYKDNVFKKVMELNLRAMFLNEIDKHRRGESVRFELAFNVAQQCVDFDVYKTELEKPFLEATEEYYKHVSSAHAAPQWMEIAEHTYEREVVLCSKMLSKDSHDIVMSTFCNVYLLPSFLKILKNEECGVKALMEDDKWSAIERMHRLATLMQKEEKRQKMTTFTLDTMADLFAEVITGHGRTLNELMLGDDTAKVKTYIVECISLYDKYREKVATHLNEKAKDCRFVKALSRGFTTFFNQKMKKVLTNDKTQEQTTVEVLACEQLAQYVDLLLKHDAELGIGTQEEEDQRIEQCVVLFTHLNDKDMFQEMYKVRLAKRLLASSPKEESEKSMLEKLKSTMGPSYTHHFEQMLKDMDVGKTLQVAFQESEQYKKLPTDINVQVLTIAHWPQFKSEKMTVPLSLRVCLESFTAFYKGFSQGHQNRVLQWVFSFGGASITAQFAKGSKEIQLNNLQAMTLVLVDGRPYSVQELAQTLSIPVAKLKPMAASLCLNKTYQVLKKVVPEGGVESKGFNETDVLEYNMDFQHKLRKLKIPQPLDSSEQRKTVDVVLEQRKNKVECCIVRVMKKFNVLKFQQLISEVTTQLQHLFEQDVKLIKAQIGELVTRGYLERDETDLNLFRYLTH